MDHPKKASPTRLKVAYEITVGLIPNIGFAVPIEAELRYDSADPYAVTMVFREPEEEVQWTFGRHLLTHGLFEPTGNGNVRVYPALHEGTTGSVMIELCTFSPAPALIEVGGQDLSLFLAEISGLVPVGTEPAHMDIDHLVAALLDTHNN